MTLQGYTVPRTPRGQAGLVPPPPWHYVADFLVVDFHADPDAAVSLLPEGLAPHPDPGRCAAVFADWQSCSETGDELIDPVRSHYREFYLVVSGLLDGEEVTTCAFIWVDQDFALARGWIQGFPKKLGEVWMTRAYALAVPGRPGHPRGLALRGHLLGSRAPDRAGAGHAGGAQRRRARCTPPRRSSTSATSRAWPPATTTTRPSTSSCARAAATARCRRSGRAAPSWQLFDAPGEEHTMLAPVSVERGYRFTFAYTVDDLETVRELRADPVGSFARS